MLWGWSHFVARGEILGLSKGALQRRLSPNSLSPIQSKSQGIEDD